MKLTDYTTGDVEVISQQAVFDGFFKMTKYRMRHRLFNGGWSPTLEREMFERGHAVAVLPYDPKRDEFVLIEQFRLGAMATSEHPWLIEVVAGIIDDGENEEQVCQREASEEANLEITALYKALSYLSSPGGTTERLHVYMARIDASKAGGVHGLDDEGEDIRVLRVSVEEAMNWLEQGKIDNAATVIALQWFALNKQRLLDIWDVKK